MIGLGPFPISSYSEPDRDSELLRQAGTSEPIYGAGYPLSDDEGMPPNMQGRGFRDGALDMTHDGVEERISDYDYPQIGYRYPYNFDGV